MKTFLKKNLIAVFALVVGIGTMSFKMIHSSSEYHYVGNDAGDGAFAEEGNWEPGAGEGCRDEGDFPCTIVTDDLATTLAGKTNPQVLNISSKRD
ncbi:MAG: hypothetical protein KF870_18165 [Leadbetterella sp.]|nr:hypothetical protein [Leadbetterella sp.]